MSPAQPVTVDTKGQVKKSVEERFLDCALWYAKRGWAVFPVYIPRNGQCSCPNPACTATGKHPCTVNGFLDATTDENTVSAWWEYDFPLSNVGIRTGQGSGLVVLDVDPRHGGDESLRQLEAQYGPLPETATVLSGGDGRHLYFQHPGFDVRSVSNALGIGLDVKGDKGSIIAPPSLHASGQLYKWELGKSPDKVPLAPCPVWLSDLIQEPRGQEGASPTERLNRAAQFIPEGQRNSELTRLAGAMWRQGCTEETLVKALLNENDTRCTPPLSEKEVKEIARSVARYPQGRGTTLEGKGSVTKAPHNLRLVSAPNQPERL